VPQMDGVPLDAGMFYFFSQYLSAHADPSNPDCATLSAQLDKAQSMIDAHTTSYDYELTLTPDEEAALSQTTSTIEATALTCLKPPASVDFEALFDQFTGFLAGS